MLFFLQAFFCRSMIFSVPGPITIEMSGEGISRVLELEQRLRQLALLQDAVRKINSTLDLDQLLNEIVIDLARAFGCNHRCLLLSNERSNELEIIAIHGFSGLKKGYRFKPGKRGMVAQVANCLSRCEKSYP
jgi:transcriptional regulator with GAF, ATPase, and Fis domain